MKEIEEILKETTGENQHKVDWTAAWSGKYGYAINEKRLQALEKTVDIQTRMIADALNVEEAEVLRAVNCYASDL